MRCEDKSLTSRLRNFASLTCYSLIGQNGAKPRTGSGWQVSFPDSVQLIP